MGKDILIVDDEPDIRNLVADILTDEGFLSRTAATGEKALEEIALRQPHLLILDIWLGDPKYDGLKILELIKKTNPDLPIVMISGHGTVETAVKAIKLGAYDFIVNPILKNLLRNNFLAPKIRLRLTVNWDYLNQRMEDLFSLKKSPSFLLICKPNWFASCMSKPLKESAAIKRLW